MLTRLRDFFSPPVFENDEEQTFQARIAFIVSLTMFVIIAGGTLINLAIAKTTLQVPFQLFSIVSTIIATILIKQKRITPASYILIMSGLVTIYGNNFLSGGLQRPAFNVNVILLAAAMLLFRNRGLLFTSVALVIANIVVLAIQTISPEIIPLQQPPTIVNIAVINTFTIVSSAALMQFAISNFNQTLKKVRISEEAFKKSNQELQSLSAELEKRVSARTFELEKSNRQTERRARQLTAIAEISRSIAAIRDTETLLATVTKVISARLGFYHTGIFLIEERREYAALKAASSEGGNQMLLRRHKLRVGETGIVGYVTGSGKPRIALDTGADAIHFKNPDLPGTRSELALPLFIKNQIGGALDIQSTEPNAFSQEDIEVLSTLANQVAVAIENAELFSQTNKALAESQAIYQRFVQENWSRAPEGISTTGFRLVAGKAEPLLEHLDDPDLAYASSHGEVIIKQPSESGQKPSLAVPVMLRGETIGVLGVRTKNENKTWREEDVSIAVTLAERLALALENARLVQDSQSRASRERTIAQISARISAENEIDTILRTTVEELNNAVNASEVFFKLNHE